jgi:hypothetical protein
MNVFTTPLLRRPQVNTATWILIFIVAVLAAGCVGVGIAIGRRRSQKLRDKFGPEYDYALEKIGDQRKAEDSLKEREKRVTGLDIHPLDETNRDRYQGEWIKIQGDFVDDPSASVEEANRLITEVMIARGFPVADFEQREADLSVMVPDFVSNYRKAYAIAMKNQHNQTSTEELRQAMIYYHSLFNELLGTVETKEVEAKEKELTTQ